MKESKLDLEWREWNNRHPDLKMSRQEFREWRGMPKSERVTTGLYGRVHIVIGDTQTKPGVNTSHLEWIGRYIVDHFASRFAAKDVSIVHLGDAWDFPSLSSYDKGKKSMEGRRYIDDIEAGNAGWDRLCTPLKEYNAGRRKEWWPSRDLLLGNHEARVTRACELDAQIDGALSLDDLNAAEWGWTVHPFLQPMWLDGIAYSHYWYNPNTGKPYGGALLPRLKTIGHSFTQGHSQGFDHALRPVGNTIQHGLVNGSCYLHDENYLGYQGNTYWRGIAICHQVENGSYDLMQVSLDYLCRRYENKTLAEFMRTCQPI